MFLFYRLSNAISRIAFSVFIGPFLGGFGQGSAILRPRGLEGIRRIHVGRNVHISDGALLAAMPLTGSEDCRLEFGDGCSIGRNNHIYATQSIIFEANVLTANNVYVSDNAHTFTDLEKPILSQPIRQLSTVRIGEGSWLGQNVCVIGASVGRGCVIGANSVVLMDIPDHHVAAGAPARIIRALTS